MREFHDVVLGSGAVLESNVDRWIAEPTVTCDQPFYPFAIVYQGAVGNSFSLTLPAVDFVPPVKPLGTVP